MNIKKERSLYEEVEKILQQHENLNELEDKLAEANFGDDGENKNVEIENMKVDDVPDVYPEDEREVLENNSFTDELEGTLMVEDDDDDDGVTDSEIERLLNEENDGDELDQTENLIMDPPEETPLPPDETSFVQKSSSSSILRPSSPTIPVATSVDSFLNSLTFF